MLRFITDTYYIRPARKLLSSKNCFYKIFSSLQMNPWHTEKCALSSAVSYSDMRAEPVKLSYDSYKSTKDPSVSPSPIVIMHGLLGSKTNWRSLCKDINRTTGHSIYAIDARNHGESPHSEYFDYHYIAADVENFLREMNINRAILIGHSMGGRSAMIAALNRPELVEKLVVVDISPVSTADAVDSNIPNYIEAMLSCLKEIPAGTPLPQARNIANKLMTAAVPNIATRQFLLTNLMESNNQIKWRCNLEVLLKKFKHSIQEFPPSPGQYNGKTLFICGSLSPYVPKTDHEKIRKIFPNSQFIYIEGAGHWVHSEKPTEFTKILLEFIQN